VERRAGFFGIRAVAPSNLFPPFFAETNPVLQPTIKMLTSSESIGRPQKVSKARAVKHAVLAFSLEPTASADFAPQLLAIVTNIRTSCSGNILVKLRVRRHW
jgi:hypothetical protein